MKDKNRYLVTVGAVLGYYLLSLITLYNYPEAFSSPKGHSSIGLFALGLMPVYSGFMIIEIASFFLPPFSKWRKQGVNGRKNIHKFQLILSFLLAGLQSWGTFALVKSYESTDPMVVWGLSGLAAKAVLLACLLSGVIIFYSLVSIVNRYGAINGFILFLFLLPLASKSYKLIEAFRFDQREVKLGRSLTPNWLWASNFSTLDQKMDLILIIFALIGLGFILFKRRKWIMDMLHKYPFQRPELIYKTLKISYKIRGSSLPQTITGGPFIFFWGLQFAIYKFWFDTMDGTLRNLAWGIASAADYVLVASILWLLFSSHRWVNYQLEGRAFWTSGREDLKRYFIFWLIVITTSTFLMDSSLFSRHSSLIFQIQNIILNPIFILTLIVFGREIIEKLKFDKWVPHRVCLAEMDNVALVQLWAAQLEKAKISFHIEGLRYRQLTQFFEPFLKMRLFVDKRHVGRASRIIQLQKVKQI